MIKINLKYAIKTKSGKVCVKHNETKVIYLYIAYAFEKV